MASPERKPSEFALRLLGWFCPPVLHEGIEGDLVEAFEKDASEVGERIARRRMVINALRFFQPGIVFRNKYTFSMFRPDMLRNYLLIATRNALKNKMFTTINVLGLAIGLAACILIVQFVVFQLSFDRFNEKFDRIVRVTNDRFQNGKLIQHGTIMYPTIGPAMAADFPEVEAYTRMMPGGDLDVKVEENLFRNDYFLFADEHFFSVFSYPLLAGERESVLKDRYAIVLTEDLALKYFGESRGSFPEMLGKVIYMGTDPQPYKVTGVCENIPPNSHLRFDAFVSYSTLISPENHDADDSWVWSDMRHYLVLKPGVSSQALEAKFDAFSERHFKGDEVSGSVEKFFLQPLRDAHLYSDYEYDIAETASGKAVWSMLVVAGFILLIAWINYINLTTSRALERAKEVGLRKVMGAYRSQLVRQFIFESVVISVLALLIAVLMVQLSQSEFNQLVRSNLSWWAVFEQMDVFSWIVLAGVLSLGILLSGFYPAFVLSSYQPVTVLKGAFQRSGRGEWLRKGLVVFQFTASVALITGTLVVSRQLKYMNEAELGISLNDMIVVEPPTRTAWDSTFINRVESFKTEISKIPDVVNVATSNNVPGARLGRTFDIHLADQPAESHYTMSFMGIDYSFVDTYQVPLVAGRNFLATDHHVEWEAIRTLLINVEGIKLLGFREPQEAVGKEVSFWGKTWTIVGVVADFHQQALKRPIEAMLFFPEYGRYHRTSIKVRRAGLESAIGRIEATYKEMFPGNAFQYDVLEDRFNRQYDDDNRFGQVVSVFTVLAIFIACLGLIGLSSYTALQRTKEIGIRKVLGASVISIVALLSSGYGKLLGIAGLLALPIAYYGMGEWLSGYVYRIQLNWTLFAWPMLIIVIIAVITVSVQILRAATRNPATTLRHE